MGRFKLRNSNKAGKHARVGLSIDDSWKLLDYPTSLSDSDTDQQQLCYVNVEQSTSRPGVPRIVINSDNTATNSDNSDKSLARSRVNTMPLEHTRYAVETSSLSVTREASGIDWGAKFVENTARVGSWECVRSLLVADLADDCLLEKAGIKCGDVITGINGCDLARWTYEEMLEELDTHNNLELTLITNKQQQIKYLLFLDLVQSDLTNLWALNNLVSLHICKTKLKSGTVDLRGISCAGVLQELAVTKSELDCISGIKGLEKFVNLRRLYLNHNSISYLDETLLKLTSLEDLRLGNNSLDKFPTILTDMASLRDLCLVYNLISTIPQEVIKMRNLESLQLDYNYLSEMPEYVTQQLPSLRCLTFSHNQLFWKEASVRDCFHLNLLDFSDNGVRARTGLDNFGVTAGRATLRRRGRGKETSLLKRALSKDVGAYD